MIENCHFSFNIKIKKFHKKLIILLNINYQEKKILQK